MISLSAHPKFQTTSRTVSEYFLAIFYGIASLLAIINFLVAVKFLRCRNLTVILLLSMMLVNALTACASAIFSIIKVPALYVQAAH